MLNPNYCFVDGGPLLHVYLVFSFFRMLYFKFINMYDRADNETHPCPMNKCPMVQIKNIHGNRNDADCRRRLYHNVRTADVRLYKVT